MFGLGYLHANEIIYADLKPSTILLNEYNILKLSDFGIARRTIDCNEKRKESQAD